MKPLAEDDAGNFSSFDIQRAQCFLRSDRQRLLAIVESSYSSLGHFNGAVRQLLAAKVKGGGAASAGEEGVGEKEKRETKKGGLFGRASGKYKVAVGPEPQAAPRTAD